MNRDGVGILVMGASAGGIRACRRILQDVGRDLPVPIVIVQHIAAQSQIDFAHVFCHVNGPAVEEATEKSIPRAGHAYVAPPGYHLLFEKDGSFSLTIDDPVNWSRPSIDVLFETTADAYRERATAVVLTGANADGAQGARAIKASGGHLVVQNPVGAEVDVMPRAAIRAATPDAVLPLEEIGPYLVAYYRRARALESKDVS